MSSAVTRNGRSSSPYTWPPTSPATEAGTTPTEVFSRSRDSEGKGPKERKQTDLSKKQPGNVRLGGTARFAGQLFQSRLDTYFTIPGGANTGPRLTQEQWAICQHGAQGHSFFFTGRAGKSFLLRAIIEERRSVFAREGEVVVLAPTGVAAEHVGGRTLHSFMGFGYELPTMEEVRTHGLNNSPLLRRVMKAKVLILDESTSKDPMRAGGGSSAVPAA
ncbi:hypothetical protein CALCODRAFT_559197 [Calocera cornea HHB12733]|uniref:ATP-dependent DNA helicase n=1 Tax=Calocera cornea HHB12733 TaxID=1353952 RepID=A0A165C4W0_9BASI|nr:hypothetical protein CALCODRAFT_559197 [Calocera cornea HHB12733]